MPYYFYHKSTIWHLNTIFDWKLAQLLLGGFIIDKTKNLLWGIFSYFNTGVPTPNEQPFLNFFISPPYYCSDLSLLNFYYIFLYCYYSYVDIFNEVTKLELNLFQ